MSLRNHGRSVLICCGLQASTQHTDHECPNACRGRTTCWTYLNYSLLALPNWPQVHGEPRHHRPALPHHGRRDHPGGVGGGWGAGQAEPSLGSTTNRVLRGKHCYCRYYFPGAAAAALPLPHSHRAHTGRHSPLAPGRPCVRRTPWSWAATTTRAMRRWAWFL